MPNNEIDILKNLELRGRQESFQKLINESQINWYPAPQEGVSPIFPVMEGDRSGVTQEEVVDLYSLKPHDLIYFTCSNPHAFYLVRIGDMNRITLWRDWAGKTTGLSAGRDDLVTIDQRTMTNEGMVKAYPGFLFTQGFQGMKPRISMPYFDYDEGRNVKEPQDTWIDSITHLFIKKQDN